MACSLVALCGKLQESHLRHLLNKLTTKLVKARSKSNKNEDAACIAVKAVAAELPESEGAVLVNTCMPLLLSGLTAPVRPTFSSPHASRSSLFPMQKTTVAVKGERSSEGCAEDVQEQGASVRQDALDAICAVASRFGAHLPEPWPVVEALLAEVQGSTGSHLKRALACIRALSPLVHLSRAVCEGHLRHLVAPPPEQRPPTPR